MHTRLVIALVLGIGLLLPGCSWKGYRDYCDKCQEDYTEDGCKASAKSEAKYAKVLGCGKEFRELSKCLKDESSCSADACDSEGSAYFRCLCDAEYEDTSVCRVL